MILLDISHGNSGQHLYLTDQDRCLFLELLAEFVGWAERSETQQIMRVQGTQYNLKECIEQTMLGFAALNPTYDYNQFYTIAPHPQSRPSHARSTLWEKVVDDDEKMAGSLK